MLVDVPLFTAEGQWLPDAPTQKERTGGWGILEGWERQKRPFRLETGKKWGQFKILKGYLGQTRYVRRKNKKEEQETADHSSILFALYATYVDDFQKILR